MEDPVIDHNQEVLSDNEDINPRPNRQRRVELESYEEQLSLHPIFRSHLFDEISLTTLESDGASQHRLTFKYIDVKIIRIITSSAAAANVYSRKRPNLNQNTMKFSRLILPRSTLQQIHQIMQNLYILWKLVIKIRIYGPKT